jgi:hypothetical protein
VPFTVFEGLQMLVDPMLSCWLGPGCDALVMLLSCLRLLHLQSQCNRIDFYDIP